MPTDEKDGNMKEIVIETIVDSVKLLPFLLLTYLLMEWLEHKTEDMTRQAIERSGRFGPLLGAVLGAFPQCGFSAAGSGLYAGRVITLGTLLAIYLSTSDEMLPIMISQGAPTGLIARILLCKVSIGFLAGLAIDIWAGKRAGKGLKVEKAGKISEKTGKGAVYRRCHGCCMRADDGTHSRSGHPEVPIWRAALQHTLQVTFFLFLVTFCFNTALFYIGEEALSNLFLNYGILGELTAGLIGLIPNCASSVMITQLYLEGVLSFGAMLSGLLTGSGVGLLVLYRVNRSWKENVAVTALLYVIGTACGILVNTTISGV